VFVHGALCYSYSGQCLFSSLVGGRSGNRGRCAQPCRLPYALYSDRQGKHALEGRYLLSPSDLALIDYLPALNDIGVHSLKIEGRMKRPEYVAIVTRAYRQIMDSISELERKSDPEVLKQEMAKIFNRNFTPGYLDAGVLRRLSTQRPNNRGVYNCENDAGTEPQLIWEFKASRSHTPDPLGVYFNTQTFIIESDLVGQHSKDKPELPDISHDYRQTGQRLLKIPFLEPRLKDDLQTLMDKPGDYSLEEQLELTRLRLLALLQLLQ
jgi:hypothetical protein